jgi:predicted AAA+ superfamily ATPase
MHLHKTIPMGAGLGGGSSDGAHTLLLLNKKFGLGFSQSQLIEMALQLGSEVSYNELAQLLEVDKATVAKYIDLLEKTYIVFRLRSFSRNMRNEIKNNRKIYFYDNGIRNAIIQNLNPLDVRADKGALWENFLISERIKLQSYHRRFTNNYFWRTVQKQEIDFVEERNGQLSAFEFKWTQRKKDKIPASFLEAYQAEAMIIDKENFRTFVRSAGE